MRTTIRRFLIPIAAGVVALSGCDGGGGGPKADSSAKEVKLTGKVTIKGAPAKGGTVTFDPGNNFKRAFSPRTAPIKGDGTYEIATMTGANIVSVNTPETARDASLGYNNQTIDVKPDSSTLDIQVSPGGSPTPGGPAPSKP